MESGFGGEPQVVSVAYDTAKRTCYCRGCGDDIEKGDLRVTVTTAAYYGDDEPGNWTEAHWHPNCHLQDKKAVSVDYASTIIGWDSLTPAAQSEVLTPAVQHILVTPAEAKQRGKENREARSRSKAGDKADAVEPRGYAAGGYAARPKGRHSGASGYDYDGAEEEDDGSAALAAAAAAAAAHHASRPGARPKRGAAIAAVAAAAAAAAARGSDDEGEGEGAGEDEGAWAPGLVAHQLPPKRPRSEW